MATVTGTVNDDVLTGSAGADTFVFTENSGNDTISDFEPGTDIIDLSCFGQEITWAELSAKIATVTTPGDPATVTGIVIDLTEWDGGTIVLDGITSVSDLTEASFKIPAVTVIQGTEGYDLLYGSSGMDEMHGGGEGDILDAGTGDDTLWGDRCAAQSADTFVFGVVEGGCKHIIGTRLKRGGMRWTVAGANAIIALRCAVESNRFDDFWERRACAAA